MMSEKKWFVLVEDKVQGPFNAEDILAKVDQGLWTGCRFWTKGSPQWMILSHFRMELDKERRTHNEKQQDEPVWYVKENSIEYGPLTYSKLLDFLKAKPNYKNVLVTNESHREWREVYHIDFLMDKLGVNRRGCSRVPIDGTIAFQDGNLKGTKLHMTTISQGGFGIQYVKGLSIGEKIKGSLMSSNFSAPIYIQAEVVSINQNGFIGARFLNLSTEGLTQIIAYVKQFVHDHPEVDYQRIA